MNCIKQNIKYLREKNNLGQTEFASLFGLTRDNIASYERGSEPKIDILSAIVNHFHVSMDDFIHTDLAEAESKAEESKPDGVASTKNEFVMRSDKREETQRIPLYNVSAAAGLVQLFNGSENVIDYISIPNLPKCDGAVHITGDSMYPLLKSGDIVMYKQVHDIQNNIFWGEMYLLSITVEDEDLTLVKYIQKSDVGPDYVKLVSQNTHHAPKDIPLSSIRALGFIKGSIRFNSMN